MSGWLGADADKKRRELVEARNNADALIHTTEKNLGEFGDKVGDEDKQAIEADIAALKEVLDGDDAQAIKDKSETLVQSSMKLGEAVYKAQQAEAATESEPGTTSEAETSEAKGGDDENVVDADFEEVDDDDDKKSKSA